LIVGLLRSARMGEGESQDLLVQIFEERERRERARVTRK
jgi:hypothetical protein